MSTRRVFRVWQIDRLSNDYLPDVGLRPCLVVLGGFCGQFCSIGTKNVIGILIAYYQQNQLADLSPSVISWIGSIQSFIVSLLVTASGCILITVGMIATAFCKQYYQFVLAQGICASLGAAGLFYGPTAALSGWFCSRRGLAFGIAASGASIGGISLSLIFENVSSCMSFREAVCMMTAVLFVFSLAATVATFPRLPPPGTQPYQLVKLYIHPFLDSFFFALHGVDVLNLSRIYVPMAYFASSAIAEGIPVAKSLQIITYFNVGFVLWPRITGLASGKMDKFALFSIITLIAGLVSAPFWYYSHSEATIIIVAISPAEEIGTRIGVFSGVIAFAALASLPIAGAIVGTDGNYNGLKIYGGVVLIAGAMVVGSVNFKLSKVERSCGYD
ncbi:major facilitator superfamily domain-containing protein [Lipomyces mesembrius]